MADKKISQLTSATTLTGAELVPVVQAGATVQTTVNDLGVPLGAATIYTPAGTGAVASGQRKRRRGQASGTAPGAPAGAEWTLPPPPVAAAGGGSSDLRNFCKPRHSGIPARRLQSHWHDHHR